MTAAPTQSSRLRRKPDPAASGGADRTRWPAIGAVLVIWVVGWFFLQGKQTLVLPRADLTDFQNWLNDVRDTIEEQQETNFLLKYVVGGISDALTWVVEFLQELFSQPAPPRLVPEIGWLGVVAIALLVAYALAGLRIATLVTLSFLAFGYLGYWADSIDTLIVTGVSVSVCVLIGLPAAIWMARSTRARAAITPVLDVMQTVPSFAYLTPLVLFFGITPAAAVVVTVIYAMPPLVRIASHALRSVAPTTMEATTSLGSTRTQQLRKVQLPMSRRTILVGLNQTTMAALAMATVAALINGPGLGKPVLSALQTLDVGDAFVSGLCIVIMAIMLDRTTTAAGERSEVASRSRRDPRLHRAVLAVLAVATVVCIYLSRTYLRFAEFPDEAGYGRKLADWTNSANEAVIDAIRPVTQWITDVVSSYLLNPLQSLMADSPWWLMAGVLIALSYLLGGLRALVSTVACILVILGTGLWNDSMVTLSMTLVATVIVLLFGLVFGVWMGRSRRVDTMIRPILDALQTMPPFVYLVPALALFGTTRLTAIFAAVAYAAPVAIKLIADGIRGVASTTVEAAQSAGTSTPQMIRKVQLPMARGALVLASNQGLLFVLSMVVIGGLVGGGGLGYLVVSGFSQAQLFGKGLAAGIAITALGVMIDRISVHTAARYGRSGAS